MIDADELDGRGVYLARWLNSEGRPVAYALDSQGRHVDHLTIEGTVTFASAARILSRRLELADPVPTLRLVKAGDPPIRLGAAPPGVAQSYLGLVRQRSPRRA